MSFVNILSFIQNEIGSFAPIGSSEALLAVILLHLLAFALFKPEKQPAE